MFKDSRFTIVYTLNFNKKIFIYTFFLNIKQYRYVRIMFIEQTNKVKRRMERVKEAWYSTYVVRSS